MIIDYIGLMS